MRHLIIKGALVALLTIGFWAPAQGESLYMVSEEWRQATEADGTGLYWDLMRAVYEPEGYELKHGVFPYPRAVRMVHTRKADFWVGSYMDESSQALYPQPDHYFHHDEVRIAVRSGERDAFTDPDSLEGKTVACVRGYAYQQYLDVAMDHFDLTELESGLRMLAAGRVDAVMDAGLEIRDAIETTDLSPDQFAVIHITDLPLYPAFQDTARGRKLRDIYDRRFPGLLESSRIKALYDRYDDYEQYEHGLAR